MFKVITWNVNSIKSRLERTLDLLSRENPDILMLQEIKCVEEKFPKKEFEEKNYYCTVLGQKAYNGVAILSKEEPEKIYRGLYEDPASRFLGVKVRGMYFYNGYIPNGQAVGSEKYLYKLEWLNQLINYFIKNHKPTDPIILAGDFNIAPEDKDVHDPALWQDQLLCSKAEREALKRLEDWGFTDSFRLFEKEAGFYSWWDYRNLSFPMNLGLRIDYILTTQAIKKLCKNSRIIREERKGNSPSDHAPVQLELILDY